MHEVLVNHLGGLSLPRKSVVRLTDRPDMILDVKQQYNNNTTTEQLFQFWIFDIFYRYKAEMALNLYCMGLLLACIW